MIFETGKVFEMVSNKIFKFFSVIKFSVINRLTNGLFMSMEYLKELNLMSLDVNHTNALFELLNPSLITLFPLVIFFSDSFLEASIKSFIADLNS